MSVSKSIERVCAHLYVELIHIINPALALWLLVAFSLLELPQSTS